MLVPAGQSPEDIANWDKARWEQWAQEQEEMTWLVDAVQSDLGIDTTAVDTGTAVLATGPTGVDTGAAVVDTDVVVDTNFARLQRAANRVADATLQSSSGGDG
jgi:hypothetical protein